MLSTHIKEKLQEKGWAVYHLHRISGVSTGSINAIRDGKTKKPEVEILKKLARAFNEPYELWMEKAGYLNAANIDTSGLDEKIESKLNECISVFKELKRDRQEIAVDMIKTLVEGLK